MSEMQSILPENIILSLQENNGQIAIGNYVVQIGSIHGGVVNIALPDQRPQLHPRETADPTLLPPSPFLFLDRIAETETAIDHLRRRESVEIYGLNGIGKTTLLEHLAQQAPIQIFPNGVVYLSGRRKLKDDLLQELFDAFHEFDSASSFTLKPTFIQIQRAFRGKKVLLILDDATLDKNELKEVQGMFPSFTLLLASAERRWWRRTEGQAVSLAGLPLENALELLEYELNRPFTSEEHLAARVLCAALQGHPDHLIQAVALVREGHCSLPEIVYQIQHTNPAKGLAELILATLSEPERIVTQTLAALQGAPLPLEHLDALTGLPDTEALIEKLRQRGLVQAHSPRYSLTGGLGQLLFQDADLTSYLERGLVHFILWTETHLLDPERLLQDLEPISQILNWAIRAGRWVEALRLVRAIDPALALGKRWTAWEQTLQAGLQAAQAANNRAAEAWVSHQLGSRALCLGETRIARSFLNRALELREGLGDYIGTVITRHNLNLLPPAPPTSPGPSSGSTPPNPNGATLWPESSVLPLVVVALAVLIPLLFLGWLSLGQSSALEATPAALPAVSFATSTPPASRSLSPTSIFTTSASTPLPTPTGAPPPTIAILPPAATLALPTPTPVPLLPAASPSSTPTIPPTATTTSSEPTPASPQINSIEPGFGEVEREVTIRIQGENFIPEDSSFRVELLGAGSRAILLLGDLRTGTAFEAVVPTTLPVGRYDLQVTNPDNRTTLKSAAFEIVQPATPEPPVQADLVITRLEATGQGIINAQTQVELPIQVVIKNNGAITATTFKVAASYTNSDNTEALPVSLTANTTAGVDPADGISPVIRQEIAPGQEMALAGLVTFPPEEHGAEVSLTVLADSCRDETGFPDHCRIEEVDETNNRSASLSLSLPAESVLACVEFEEVSPGPYKVQETLSDSGVRMVVKPFFPPEGDSTDQGLAEVEFYGEGTQRRVFLQRVNLGFDFGASPARLALTFGHVDGNLNLEINGEFKNLPQFSQLNGTSIGGVTATVQEETEFSGQLQFSGIIESFAIGGQELWLDTICLE